MYKSHCRKGGSGHADAIDAIADGQFADFGRFVHLTFITFFCALIFFKYEFITDIKMGTFV